MQKFINLECHNEPETTLFPQETDLLQELIRGTLERVAPNATRGTFILDGQKFGEEAKCILRFNLPEGNYRYQPLLCAREKTSDQMAEESIDEMLAIPGKSRYINGGRPVRHEISNDERNMTNGVYREDDLMVLVLNATHGRFLMSCYLDGGDSTAAELVLYAVAQAIAAMGKEDITLQRSDRDIFGICQRVSVSGHMEIRQYIEDAFEVGEGLAMMAWKAWHEPANTKGELTLFFE